MEHLAPAIPLTHLSLSVVIYALALDHWSRRHLWLAPLLFFQCLAFATANRWPNNGIDSLWGLMTCVWMSHSLSVLLLEDRHLSTNDDIISRRRSRYWKAWMTWNNPRLLGTAREEACTPKTFYGHRSRLVFTIFRSAKVTSYCLVTKYVQPLVLPGVFVPFRAADFDEIRQTYFRRILFDRDSLTVRETALRAVFAVFWAWGAYMMIDGAHSALSVVSVSILRLDKPLQWPPIFGSLQETDSLRRFWGRFWHRLVVLPYGNYGKVIADRVFGFRPGSTVHKLVVAFTIFSISGVAHAGVAWQLGDRCGWHLDLWWFCLNFTAIAVESVVLLRFRRSREKSNTPQDRKSWLYLRRCCGYLWVFLFFFWSVPKWQYPKVHCAFADAPALATFS
jgi:hypothetical protein